MAMSLKAFFLFIAAAVVAFAIKSGDEGGQTITLSDSVGKPIVTTRL